MCGIVGNISKANCLSNLINGLKELEYRGYDSAGLILDDFSVFKTTESIDVLRKMTEGCNRKIGMAHTRWATHGKICLNNTHPIKINRYAVVHNGIIENHEQIRKDLNYKKKTDTDSEILLALFIKYFEEMNDPLKALRKMHETTEGAYAAVFMIHGSSKFSSKLYWAKKGSVPLIAAKNDSDVFVASDENAISKNATIYDLPANCCGYIDSDEIFADTNDPIKQYSFTKTTEDTTNCYSSFFEKEMNEQAVFLKSDPNPELIDIDLTKFEEITLIGCGSAYIACNAAKFWFEKLGFKAYAEVASEWNIRETSHAANTLFIILSQSGETADTILAIDKIKKMNHKILAIVNRENSTIAKMADYIIPLKIGTEQSVASSKAFTAMLLNLYYLSHKNIPNSKLNIDLAITLNLKIEKIVATILESSRTIIIGRNALYSIAQEGVLKMKELSYINAEAYQAGELKHGYLAIVDDHTCLISLASKDNEKFGSIGEKLIDELRSKIYAKTISNTVEAQSRGAKIILLSSENEINADHFVKIEGTYDESLFYYVVFLQRIAFELAKAKGNNIDRPRNLSKSITVE